MSCINSPQLNSFALFSLLDPAIPGRSGQGETRPIKDQDLAVQQQTRIRVPVRLGAASLTPLSVGSRCSSTTDDRQIARRRERRQMTDNGAGSGLGLILEGVVRDNDGPGNLASKLLPTAARDNPISRVANLSNSILISISSQVDNIQRSVYGELRDHPGRDGTHQGKPGTAGRLVLDTAAWSNRHSCPRGRESIRRQAGPGSLLRIVFSDYRRDMQI